MNGSRPGSIRQSSRPVQTTLAFLEIATWLPDVFGVGRSLFEARSHKVTLSELDTRARVEPSPLNARERTRPVPGRTLRVLPVAAWVKRISPIDNPHATTFPS